MAEKTLDTGKKYIKEIFEATQFYNIPEYQRPYVWGNDQVQTMLDDIANAMQQDSKREYFLGCMIWNSKNDNKNEISFESKDILDGQQRFITLYLLKGILRDLSSNGLLKKTISESLKQEKNEYKATPERNRLEFSIRKDKVFFDKFIVAEGGTSLTMEMEENSAKSDTGNSVKKMTNAVSSINQWWKEKKIVLKHEKDFQEYVSEFYTYLSNKVIVLYLSTSDNLDDAYNLFTVLNSRGIQLQSSDILRAQNLRNIKDDNLRKNYASQWDDNQSIAEEYYRSYDEFLWTLVYTIMKYTSDSNQTLNKAFDYMHKRGDLTKGRNTFEFADKYIQHLEAVMNTEYQFKEAGCLYENLNYILTTTFGTQHIMLLMHYRECFGENNMIEFLIKIDNLLSAAWLTENRSIQTRSFIIMRRMEEISKSNSDKTITSLQFLNDQVLKYNYIDEKASTIINIDNLFAALDNEEWGSFSGTRINKTRYILLKLDLLLSSDNTKLQFNKSVASVEHLMPQKLDTKHWSIPFNFHNTWLHRLGNIILIDKKKNSSLSNRSYLIKKTKYSSYIETRANTNYLFMTYTDWNEKNIKENHTRVLDLLKKYYTGNSLKTYKDIKKKNG